MSDPHDEPSIDRVRSALSAVADDLALDPIDPDSVRTRAGTRKRRRRVALGGGAAVVAVALVGSVVATRGSGDDTIELAEPTETTQPEESQGAGTATTSPTSPVATVPPITTPITTPPTMAPVDTGSDAVATTGAVSASPVGEVATVLPWRDGFLSIGWRYEPQPLGPLPEEISALFPPEVAELFPDGLPPTIQEATEVLTEAGLLDEVTAVLSEHPEASDAIYASEPPPPTLEASFTTDGVQWRSVAVTQPMDELGQFAVSGDRLIAWSLHGPDGDPDLAPESLVIASTTDLSTWQVVTVPIAVDDGDTDPGELLHHDAYVSAVAVKGDRWLARVERNAWFDYEAVLPDDVREQLYTGEWGYSTSIDDDGLTVVLEDGNGRADGATFVYTWAELGLSGNPESLERGSPSTLLSGTLDGSFEEVESPPGFEQGTAAADHDRFYLLGEGVATSPDGVSWERVDGLPDDQFFQSATTVDGGVLFVADGSAGSTAWTRSEAGAVSEVDLPDLGEYYGLWNSGGTSAWIVELGFPETPIEHITVQVEYEGYTLTMTDGPTTSYALTDPAGALIREAEVGPDRSELVEYDEDTDTYEIVPRDADGNEIIRIPGALLDEAYRVVYDELENQVAEEPADEWTPDLWLLATANGTDWLTVDLEPPSPDTGFWPQRAAVHDGSVLYPTVDGWVLAALPGR